MKQTVMAASAVVVVFAAGFLTGRLSVPAAPAPAAFAAPAFPAAALPAGHPEPTAAAPDEGAAPAGVVAEVIQVPNYTYLRLTTPTGDEWAAVATTNAVTVGQRASLLRGTRMVAFTSKTLSRTFSSIWFGELAPL